MRNNHIVYNEELAIFENELKSLSNLLQETYEDRGKYLFFNGLLSLLFATIFVFNSYYLNKNERTRIYYYIDFYD